MSTPTRDVVWLTECDKIALESSSLLPPAATARSRRECPSDDAPCIPEDTSVKVTLQLV